MNKLIIVLLCVVLAGCASTNNTKPDYKNAPMEKINV